MVSSLSVIHPFFEELLGQSQAVELLSQAIAHQRIAPAYLFTGPLGVGKSLAARCFAEALFSMPWILHGEDGTKQQSITRLKSNVRQGNHPDLLWVEPTYLHQGKRISASEAAEMNLKRKSLPQIRLEQIREITRFLSRPPLEAQRTVVILEQTETMAESAANALLKTLEEPGQATLILLAPSVDALLPTLVSRCQKIPFHRLSHDAIVRVLEVTGYAEIVGQPDLLATAQGSPGEAIASWNQLPQIPAELLQSVVSPPISMRQSLELARDISRTLDTDTQLWLLNHLQHRFWCEQPSHETLKTLETARRQILSYAQSQLVWEVTLLTILDTYRASSRN
ncbi:MAG: DNA polymerase III subunit delta' [Elainellaceae cyanobacterium]